MKKTIVAVLLVAGLAAMSFKLASEKNNAVVEQQDGISVFAFAKPVAKYDILGQVKIRGIVKNEKGPHMVELLVEYAKKDYPSGEGIIVNSNFEKAEVIRFKD